MTRKLMPLAIVFVLFSFLAAGGFFVWQETAIRIIVTNVGASPMRHVAVITRGERSVSMGDLGPGVTKTVRVWPRSTGAIRLRFVHGRDEDMNLNIYGYVESGYAGQIWVDVRDGKLARCINEIGVSPLPF